MSAIDNFYRACRQQESSGSPGEYLLSRDLLRRLKVDLVNMVVDEGQEEFFVHMLNVKLQEQHTAPIVSLESHLVQHLKEFLQGAT